MQRQLDARMHPLVRKLMNVDRHHSIPEDFAAIAPWFKPDMRERIDLQGQEIPCCKISVMVYQRCLDLFETDIGVLLDDYIPWQTYDLWIATRWGRDLIITNSGDFRVLDWERRMAAGEFKEE